MVLRISPSELGTAVRSSWSGPHLLIAEAGGRQQQRRHRRRAGALAATSYMDRSWGRCDSCRRRRLDLGQHPEAADLTYLLALSHPHLLWSATIEKAAVGGNDREGRRSSVDVPLAP